MTSEVSPMFPRPPRRLARHENRGTALVIALGFLLLVGISAVIPALSEEERIAKRREQIWNEGPVVEGVIETKSRSPIGRKEIGYRYRVDGEDYFEERVITHEENFGPLEVGDPIALRLDPKDPQFSVTALDVARPSWDWIPTGFVMSIIFAGGGLMVLWAFQRRRLLGGGIEVPCRVQPTFWPAFVRVKYTWHGVIHTHLVEGKCVSEGEPGAVMLDPAFPAWPVLGMHDRFGTVGVPASSPVHDLRRRWANAVLPGTIGAWVTWGLLSLLTGELMSPHLRTACILIAGVVLTFIGGRSDNDSPSFMFYTFL